MGSKNVDEVAHRVRQFYEACSFPGYEEVETPFDLADKAGRGIYMQLLDRQLPWSARVLDAGCGTGQLVNFLSLMERRVVGIDLSYNSLRKGQAFSERFQLGSARFVQMDLFRLAFREQSFDYVFSNGVLHHTADAELGFAQLVRLVKRGGHIVVGLYNRYGRLLLNARKRIFRLTNRRFLWLDFVIRRMTFGDEKKRIWFMDQYCHPHEKTFSVGDVLRWFKDNGVEYVNSLPKINLGERLTPAERLFEQHAPGRGIDHALAQAGWILTQGREGGFFILIGRRT